MLSWDHEPSLAAMQRERAWVEVNLDHLQHNVHAICHHLSPGTQLMAIVKADAYGHGAVTVAQTALAAGARWLGVATIPEGIELRKAGITAPILVLGAANTVEQVRALAQWTLQPTLCTEKQALIFADAIAQLPTSKPLPVHLNIDTGMARLGLSWPQAMPLAEWIQRSPQLQLAGVYSHFANADHPDQTSLRDQETQFKQAIAHLNAQQIQPSFLHLANSAATLIDPSLHYDLVRVGLALYGIYPAPHLRSHLSLKPVMQVKARITQVKTLLPNTGISYGHTYTTDRETRMAVLGIGYADGVPRLLSNRMTVLRQGQHLPQIGAITMDQMMIDVSQCPNVQEGDVVTLLGQDQDASISADDWANTIGSISWEILCGFKHRLPRLFMPAASTESRSPVPHPSV